MKRRILAAALLLCFAFTGCAKNVQTTTPEPVSTTVTQPAVKPAVVYSDTEIEERIRQVAEGYDGIYRMDIENAYSGAGKRTNTFSINNLVPFAAESEATMDMSTSDKIEMPVPVPAPVPGPVLSPYDEIDWNTEDYNTIRENGFVSVHTQPFSTFGADVDTATYSNLRRSLYEQDDFGIGGDAIRIEEMINYFSYDYELPEDGDKFFVKTTLTDCPWNDEAYLLRVGVRAEEIKPEKGSNIVFLIDTSGSMFDNNKLPLAQKSLKMLAENLNANDTVSIVTYAGTEEVALEGAKGSDYKKIVEAIDELEAWGSTNGEGGINKAYEIAEKYFIEGGNNRIILATDGDLNVGVSSEAGLIELVEEKRESGVFLSCLGFGSGNYKDDKMEALADYGNGNYSYIDCSREATKVLKDEMWSTLFTVAKDVKFQVEFNPSMVKGYRLIGYENRAMAAEDFADDTKDGGEVGSGQTVTVLYEIIPADSSYEIPEVESRYGNEKSENSDSDELLAVNIRYKEPDGDKSILKSYPVTMANLQDEMDEDTSWAAGVAQFGMILRESEYAGTSDYKDVYKRLKKDSRIMDDDFRAEFLNLILLASEQSK